MQSQPASFLHPRMAQRSYGNNSTAEGIELAGLSGPGLGPREVGRLRKPLKIPPCSVKFAMVGNNIKNLNQTYTYTESANTSVSSLHHEREQGQAVCSH